jgi:cellulose biosynthesis protein BcsQ
MKNKRLTLFAGHYGSGKTNVSLNYAYQLKATGYDTVIADIDTVNPYFRAKDSAAELQAAGIELIAPEFAGSNVDLPALPAAMYDIIFESEKYAVIDIGGDDRGAFALGRYTPEILRENNFNMLMVINMYRPLTSTALETVEILKEIEAASGIPFTGLVNNSNLGPDTTPETIESSLSYAKEVSKLSGLPIVATSCPDTLKFKDISDFGKDNGVLIKLKLQNKIV